VVFEYYRKPDFEHSLHCLFSITKSVVALCVDFLVQEKGEEILNRPIHYLLPKNYQLPDDARWRELTLHHLLSQSSGLHWKEMGAKWGPGNPLWEMEHHHDWIAKVLATPMASHPGRHFNYNSGASHLIPFLMGSILQTDVSELFHERLLFPLGIDRLLWESDPCGNLIGGKGLHLRAQDVCKIGELILSEGVFHGKQLVRKEWIAKCLTRQSHGLPFYGEYGYQWWIHPENIAAATGFGGQNLFIDRNLGIIGLFLGNLSKKEITFPITWFQKFRKEAG
jgi:CubicO group peptidase (beta-lactamase class C family)